MEANNLQAQIHYMFVEYLRVSSNKGEATSHEGFRKLEQFWQNIEMKQEETKQTSITQQHRVIQFFCFLSHSEKIIKSYRYIPQQTKSL